MLETVRREAVAASSCATEIQSEAFEPCGYDSASVARRCEGVAGALFGGAGQDGLRGGGRRVSSRCRAFGYELYVGAFAGVGAEAHSARL